MELSKIVDSEKYIAHRKEFLLEVKQCIEECLHIRDIKKTSKRGKELASVVMAVLANTVANDPCFFIGVIRADLDSLDIEKP